MSAQSKHSLVPAIIHLNESNMPIYNLIKFKYIFVQTIQIVCKNVDQMTSNKLK